MYQYSKNEPDRNIYIGRAAIVWSHSQKRWVFPGGGGTRDQEKAYDMAFRIHDLLKAAV